MLAYQLLPKLFESNIAAASLSGQKQPKHISMTSFGRKETVKVRLAQHKHQHNSQYCKHLLMCPRPRSSTGEDGGPDYAVQWRRTWVAYISNRVVYLLRALPSTHHYARDEWNCSGPLALFCYMVKDQAVDHRVEDRLFLRK